MSALEVFVRIRQYRDRAAEFFELAAQPFSQEVRARYLAIADHYMALADAELRTDRLIRKKRLEQMRAEREKSQRAAMTVPDRTRPDAAAPLTTALDTAASDTTTPDAATPDAATPGASRIDSPPAEHEPAPARLRLVKNVKQAASRDHSGRQQMAAQAVFTVVRSVR